VRALLSGSVKPERVIVFCNGTEPLPVDSDTNVAIINSNQNFGPVARFAVALLSDSNTFFFQDDDLVVQHDTLKMFDYYHDALPNAVLGMKGQLLEQDAEEEMQFLCEVDIVSRLFFCTREHLLQAHRLRTQLDHSWYRTDDLLLCMANRIAGNWNYVVPRVEQNEFLHLDEEGQGRRHEDGHKQVRAKMAMRLLELMQPKARMNA